jgi:hypothetical protein
MTLCRVCQRLCPEDLNDAQADPFATVRFEENDLFKADIHEATVVTLFLLKSVNVQLRPVRLWRH